MTFWISLTSPILIGRVEDGATGKTFEESTKQINTTSQPINCINHLLRTAYFKTDTDMKISNYDRAQALITNSKFNTNKLLFVHLSKAKIFSLHWSCRQAVCIELLEF